MREAIAFRAPNWLGDAVMATVVPVALKRGNPAARVHVLAPASLGDVFRGAAGVDEVVELAPGREIDAYRRGGYDTCVLATTSFGSAWRALRGRVSERLGFATAGRRILLTGSRPGREYRRDRHQVENYRALAALAGEPAESDEPHVVLESAWRREAAALWPDEGVPRVALQPGATYGPAKRWGADRFARLARDLEGVSVAVLGGPGDREAVSRVLDGAPDGVRDLSGRTSVGVLGAVLERADLVVTNDTGPMHLAAAVGTDVLAIFGSTNPTWTKPRGTGHRVVRHPVPCSPCYRRTCRIGYTCLTGIETETVRREALAILEEVPS